MPRDWMEDGRRRWRDGLSHACVRGVNTTESLPAANQAGGGAEGEVLGMPRGLWASYLATYGKWYLRLCQHKPPPLPCLVAVPDLMQVPVPPDAHGCTRVRRVRPGWGLPM